MPVYGSKAPYADPNPSLKDMKKSAKASGEFPRVDKSSQQYLYEKMQTINKGKEINTVRDRRIALDNRLTYELDTERMMADLRRARGPAFRGEGARMMNADRAAERFAAQFA